MTEEDASHSMVKLGLTLKKMVLFVRWNWKRVLHYELLLPRSGGTIDSDLYCQQLRRLLREAIERIHRNQRTEKALSATNTTLGHIHL